jgi:hypothetical protein
MGVIRYIFGYDEYLDGEHISHEPSWWQRRKAQQEALLVIWSRIPPVIEVKCVLAGDQR